MKIITILTFLVLISASMAMAQQAQPPSAFNLEVGSHMYYMLQSKMSVKGYEFSAPKSWGVDNYVTLHAPMVDVTYTHRPVSLVSSPEAVLLYESFRGDLELKLTKFVKPLVAAEYLPTQLATWAWDAKNENLLTFNYSTKEAYLGLGATFELPITETLVAKAGADYQFVNRKGYEAALGIDWTYKDFAFGSDLHAIVGGNYQKLDYKWGNSEHYGIFLEVGLRF